MLRVVGLLAALFWGVGHAAAGDALSLFVSDHADAGSVVLARVLTVALRQVPGVDLARFEGALRPHGGTGGALHEIAGMSDTLIVRSASDHFRSPRDDATDLWRQAKPIAVLSSDVLAVAVRADSPVPDFPTLMSWIGTHPRRFAAAGGSPRLGLDHLLLGLILREASLDLDAARYLPGHDMNEALARLEAGEAGIVVGPLDTLLIAERAGKARVLVTTAPADRGRADHSSLVDLGHPIVFEDWRAIMAPPRAPAAAVRRLREVVDAATRAPAWTEAIRSGELTERVLNESEFAAMVDEQERSLESVSRQMPRR